VDVNPWFEHVCGSAQSVPLFSQFFTHHDQRNSSALSSCCRNGPKSIKGVCGIKAFGSASHGNAFSFGTAAGVSGQRECYWFGPPRFWGWDIGSFLFGIISSQQGVNFFGSGSRRKVNHTALNPTRHVRIDRRRLRRWT